MKYLLQALLVTLNVHLTSSFYLCPAMTFSVHRLPVHTPGYWASRAQPHQGCALTGAPCPGSQMRMEEGLQGNSGKHAFQLGELKPREGTCLTQGHTAGTPMPLLPKPSMCNIKQIQSVLLALAAIAG